MLIYISNKILQLSCPKKQNKQQQNKQKTKPHKTKHTQKKEKKQQKRGKYGGTMKPGGDQNIHYSGPTQKEFFFFLAMIISSSFTSSVSWNVSRAETEKSFQSYTRVFDRELHRKELPPFPSVHMLKHFRLRKEVRKFPSEEIFFLTFNFWVCFLSESSCEQQLYSLWELIYQKQFLKGGQKNEKALDIP